ncbi:MAG TPA: hypothetical protein VIM73_10940 [Polyangiaceae bacterium]
MIFESILAMLVSLGVAAEDRAPELAELKREQRATVAQAISIVATEQRSIPPLELAAVLVTLGEHETNWRLRLHQGWCRTFECDRGRARGSYQLQRRSGMSESEWDGLLGLGLTPTLRATREAARRVRAARRRCRSLEDRQDWAAGVFSSLAGRGCIGDFKGRAARVAMFRRLLGRAGA